MSTSLCTNEEIVKIYEEYADMVYRIAFLLLKNRQEAEDVLQIVFIKLINCYKIFENGTHIKAWLIVTTKNSAKDIIKSWWRKNTVGMDNVKETLYDSNFAYENSVQASVMSLKPKYRLPVYLHYFEGYSTKEIAEMLNVNHSTIRSRLRIAKQKLKLILEEDIKYE